MHLQITEYDHMSPEETVDMVLRGTGHTALEVRLAQLLVHALDQIEDLKEDVENASQGDNSTQGDNTSQEVSVGHDA